MTTPPRWDMSNVYPSLESKAFKAATKKYVALLDDLEAFLGNEIAQAGPKTSVKRLGQYLGEAIDRFNEVYELGGTLHAYVYAFVSTNSRDAVAMRTLSQLEQVQVRQRVLSTRFQAWVGKLGISRLQQALPFHPSAQAHAFILLEMAEQARYLMSEAEESLAAELTLSGGNAFSKLQGTVTSQLTVEFELEGQMQKLPMPALINLRSHADESVRRRAYEAENRVWESVKETLAACLNGVKGETITLNRRRGREDALHAALDAARIDRETLQVMLRAMRESFPMFRRYFQSKAQKLGKEKLAWWDLFAPTGKTDKTYSFDEARDLILETFGTFSPDLQQMAQTAFDRRWIDAEQREGKYGGAFCMGIPAVKESRILANYDGSFEQVSTLAHELGHAYHNYCAYQAGKTEMQQFTPMTLAETASIMCETIVTEALLARATDPREQLAILEAQLINASQVIVDIYSRFLFEKEVFERREKAELSADEFCEIMERAQKATYGDGLDERYLQKFMWTWKPHYYEPRLSFYNFPYAFGLLFGLGLYRIYQQRGEAFIPEYKQLLASTGEASAADLAARFGIDIRKKRFWADSLAIIGRQIERYCELR